MQKPTDYPLKNEHSDAGKEPSTPDITYAVLRDRVDAEQPVTDEMINIARARLESAHSDMNKKKTVTGKFRLPSLRNRFRQG